MQLTPIESPKWTPSGRRRYSSHSTFSTARTSLVRIGRAAAISPLLILLFSPQLASASQFSAAVYDDIKPSVVRVTCGTRDAATGFLWSGPDTAVTALHVVDGCSNIMVQYEAQKVKRSATVIRVLRRADLALLKITDAPSAHALLAETGPPSLTEKLSTLGYPLQIPSMSDTSLQLRYGGNDLRSIVPESVARTLEGGSPSLDLEIDSIEGHLLPGHSGAPIFNERRRIVAIADGGLANGAASISWGIPAKFLTELAASTQRFDAVEHGPAGHRAASAVLFSSEIDATKGEETECSGLTLTKLKTTTFTQMVKSVDDPRGMLQIIQFFNVDPSEFTFDIYQHLASGGTFVVPTGARITQDRNGDCTATFTSGRVQIHMQIDIAGSVAEAQAKSLAFEREVGGNDPQNWFPDTQWTNLTPVTRFDGMIARRSAYGHFKNFPYRFMDKYGFGDEAFRGNVFIGSAAMYTLTPQFTRHMTECRNSGGQGDCEDVRQYIGEWVRSVVAIQLTTFPVG